MTEYILEKEYPVNSINININKNLGLFGILGMLQDIASIHGKQLGHGAEFMISNNAFWVLVQQKLKMTIWPKWQDVVRIKTWPRVPEKVKSFRDFEIFLGETKIGECVTTWMMLDRTTRKLIRPMSADGIVDNFHREYLDFIPEKIIMPENSVVQKTLEVRNSDLDMNNHVNNTKYSQWILDTIPLKYHKRVDLKEFEINFMAETHLNDKIDISSVVMPDLVPAHIGSYFKGVRHSDGKTVFIARLFGQNI